LKLTPRGAATLIVRLEAASPPLASVVVTVTAKLPELVYVWIAGLEVDAPPSPNVQMNTNGPTPPVTLAERVTDEVASGDAGLVVKVMLGSAATLIL